MFETVIPERMAPRSRRLLYELLPLSFALHVLAAGSIIASAVWQITFPAYSPKTYAAYQIISTPLLLVAPAIIPDLIPEIVEEVPYVEVPNYRSQLKPARTASSKWRFHPYVDETGKPKEVCVRDWYHAVFRNGRVEGGGSCQPANCQPPTDLALRSHYRPLRS